MPRTLDKIIDEMEYAEHHSEKKSHRSQRDIFFIWVLIMTIAVIGSHFALNFAPTDVTGFVTANENVQGNATLLLEAVFVLFITILITALIHLGITQKDY